MPKIFSLFFLFCILINFSACSNQTMHNEDQVDTKVPVRLHTLPGVTICAVPDPKVPSSAFELFHSETKEDSGYWVNYQCKKTCSDWQQCLVPAYSGDGGRLLVNGRNRGLAKQALAFVIDGMGGHLALSHDGEKTVFIHTGAGGTHYYDKPAETLEQKSFAHTVMVRWEKGYTSPIVQPPFTQPITWGWYSRTSVEATDIKQLNKRVASIIRWSHDNLSDAKMFGTLGCSMGTNATFGPVLWHGLDPIIDYQTFVGGPNMWDLNAQCKRRQYSAGFCDVDGVTRCTENRQCSNLGEASKCIMPGPYTKIDLLFNQLPNHIHVTDACDIRASDDSTLPYPPFDESSMGFAAGADWEIDHHMDFLVNLGAAQGNSFPEGLGGDEYWGLGHFPYIYNKIEPAENKHWRSYPNSHHCGAMFNEALDVIKEGMGL